MIVNSYLFKNSTLFLLKLYNLPKFLIEGGWILS